MRYFVVPFDMKSEDKVIGGYLSLRQFMWLVAPLIILIAMFIFSKDCIIPTDRGISISFSKICWRIAVDIILLANSIIMSFVKINGENSDIYVINRIKYALNQHVYI